jgi:hypothetical protein
MMMVALFGAAKIATLKDGQRQVGQLAEVPTQSKAAAMLRVSEWSVRRAREVLDNGSPDMIASVEHGDLAVSAAANIVREGKSPTAFKPGNARHVLADIEKNSGHCAGYLQSQDAVAAIRTGKLQRDHSREAIF